MKVAWFSPMPPERSGIADYSALLVPALRPLVDLRVVKRGARRPPRGTDVAAYNIGNDPGAHGWIVDALRREPGVVVLHDFSLHHLVAGITLGRRHGKAYLDALERDGGLPARLLGHAVIEQRIPGLWETRAVDLPLTREILTDATGLVVHSRYVRDRARAIGYAGPITVIPHAAWPTPDLTPAAIAGDPLIAAFGNVNASKRAPQLLEAFAAVRQTHPGARLLLVGAVSPGFDLDRRLQRHGLTDEGLQREGYVDERRLWELMSAADVHVNLRSPTMGETSGTAIRALGLGKPLVVSDVGWFSELPDDVAVKIPVDDDEVPTLAAALALLADRPEVRTTMGEAARELAVREHDVARVADRYVASLELAAGGGPVSDAVLGDVATAAADVGIAPGSDAAAELARRLSEVELGR